MAEEQKLETMASVVSHLRAHVSLIFQAVVHRIPGDTQEEQRRRIQGYIETVGQGLKKLQERGKELETELAGAEQAKSRMREQTAGLGDALHQLLEQQQWQQKVHARSLFSLRRFEEEMFARFPAKRFHSSLACVRIADGPPAKRRKTAPSPGQASARMALSTPSPACVAIPRTATPGSELLHGAASASTSLHVTASLETFSNLDKVLREVSLRTGLTIAAEGHGGEAGLPTTVQVTCPGVFQATCLLVEECLARDVVTVQRIAVYACDETPGPWRRSRYGVFRRVTEHAERGLLYFRTNYHSTALQKLLLWLMYYRTLFSAPCKTCRRHLYNDSEQHQLLPPTSRTFDQGEPLHPQCALP